MGLRFRMDLDLKWLLKVRRGIQQGFESHNTPTQEQIILCRMINKSKPVSSSVIACQLLSHSMAMPPVCSASSCCVRAQDMDHCNHSNKAVLHLSHSVTVMDAGILVVTQREDRALQLTFGLHMCAGFGGLI